MFCLSNFRYYFQALEHLTLGDLSCFPRACLFVAQVPPDVLFALLSPPDFQIFKFQGCFLLPDLKLRSYQAVSPNDCERPKCTQSTQVFLGTDANLDLHVEARDVIGLQFIHRMLRIAQMSHTLSYFS